MSKIIHCNILFLLLIPRVQVRLKDAFFYGFDSNDAAFAHASGHSAEATHPTEDSALV